MPINHQAHRYQEIEIKTATPVELVVLLYDAAIASLQKAQEHLASRDIEKRTRCLNKAISILTELQANLNFEKGREISLSLDRLYQYMKGRILQANLQQNAAPMKEVVKLLSDLRAAWAEIAQKEAQPRLQPAAETRPTPPAIAMPLAAGAERLSPLAGINVTA
jgi:flagellar secretion chaperone FliS